MGFFNVQTGLCVDRGKKAKLSAEGVCWMPVARAESESAGNSGKCSKTGRKNAESRE